MAYRYALGGYFSGEMADRYFIGRLKRLLQMWLVLAVLVYTALALALPIGRYMPAGTDSIGRYMPAGTDSWQWLLAVAAGIDCWQ